jgi:NADP-dependent 3-hydroxy acid dehydrogenase YdfG
MGAATVRALHAAGARVAAGARRTDRLDGDVNLPLDVTDPASVAAFAAEVPACRVLVANAGGALGLEPVAEADEEAWHTMYETNVLGVERVTKALLSALERGGNGHIVVIGSVAGVEVYPGGAGYTAAKHAVNALCRTLRLELLGKPIRVTEVAPGMVETEFSLVRFEGDAERAAEVYRGIEPLTAEDVADVIAFAVTRAPNVNLDYIAVKPVNQATATDYHRANSS